MAAVDTTFEPVSAPAPVRARDRILPLDVLRGLAILGILAVNASAFAYPSEVLMDPGLAPWPHTPGNRIAEWAVHVFFENKMRTLFTLLFGVSIFLVGGERGDPVRSPLLRRRLLWMAVFGLIHGLAFWYGDILLLYAWSGLFMLLMRSMSARRLLWIGGGITLFFSLAQAGGSWFLANAPAEIAARIEQGQGRVTSADVQAAIEAYRSGWSGAMIENAQAWLVIQGASLFGIVFAVVPVMMLGLGLFKAGFLSGRAPGWVYGLCMAAAAVNLAALGYWQWIAYPTPAGADLSGGLAGVAGSFSPVIAIGYAAALIQVVRHGPSLVARLLAPVGRMAFTNYLTQTLIMVSLFYMPWGPVWFGEVDPAGLWGVVGAVWVLQLTWSPLWLARFEMGPFEWLWRRLTYGRAVPLLKRA